MKIVLTTGFIPQPSYFRTFAHIKNVVAHPPLGLGYLGAALEERGHEVVLYDWLPVSFAPEDMAARILSHRPDAVGISVMSTTFAGASRIARLIKERSDVPVIFGGPHCSSFPLETLKKCPAADMLLYGETEDVFCQLIEELGAGVEFHHLPQLCYRDRTGEIRKNPEGPVIDDLDRLPFPAWHLYDRSLYRPGQITCVTSRGCAYGRCAFCMRTGHLYERYRRRSVENVIAELKEIRREVPYKEVVFCDDDFACDNDWVFRFCDALIDAKLGIRWYCSTRVNAVTLPLLKKMAQSGCYAMAYGIETAHQTLLNDLRKGITIAQVRDAVRATREAGIRTMGNFILALPGETPAMTKETIRFAIELDLDFVQFSVSRPLPGTDFYRLCADRGQILGDPYDFYDTKLGTTILIPKVKFVPSGYKNKEQVMRMFKYAYFRFFFRLRYIFKILRGHKPHGVNPLQGITIFFKILFGRSS